MLSSDQLNEMGRNIIDINKDQIIRIILDKAIHGNASIYTAACIKCGLYEVTKADEIKDIINLGYGYDECEVDDVYSDHILFRYPNGRIIRIYYTTKSTEEMSKGEFETFKRVYNELKEYVERRRAEMEKERELEGLRSELSVCKRKMEDLEYKYYNLVGFIKHKGLIDEFVEYIIEGENEERKAEIISEYDLE